MTTFFDNTLFLNLAKEQETFLYNDNNLIYKVKEEVEEMNDFFVSKTKSLAVCKDQDTWNYILSELKQEIFNSSSASYSLPERFAVRRYAQMLPPQELSYLNQTSGFNSADDLYASSDIFNYRQSRSENLLFRMIQCYDIDLTQVSLMRLSKGVFIHQKFESSIPQPSPTLSTIQECSYSSQYTASQVAPINTFHYNNMGEIMNHCLTTQCYDIFIPYTYTFGARYTNPYGDRRDLIIRGRLPLWCQTLFLSNCLKQPTSIKANETIFGLFPFAPHIPVTFKYFDADNYDNTIAPELTVFYERITMDHLDPFALPDIFDTMESQWPEKRKEILRNILICDVPDKLAKDIEKLSTLWATSQGLNI